MELPNGLPHRSSLGTKAAPSTVDGKAPPPINLRRILNEVERCGKRLIFHSNFILLRWLSNLGPYLLYTFPASQNAIYGVRSPGTCIALTEDRRTTEERFTKSLCRIRLASKLSVERGLTEVRPRRHNPQRRSLPQCPPRPERSPKSLTSQSDVDEEDYPRSFVPSSSSKRSFSSTRWNLLTTIIDPKVNSVLSPVYHALILGVTGHRSRRSSRLVHLQPYLH